MMRDPDRAIAVAFVGCTHPHIFPRIELLRAAPGVTLVGCYDPDSRLSAALERDHGLTAYPSPEALLDQRGVNFVVIEGWDTDNPGFVRAAIARGQAILLEKPGAPHPGAKRNDSRRTRAAAWRPWPSLLARSLTLTTQSASVNRLR
jgi:predicted dehydrogenase